MRAKRLVPRIPAAPLRYIHSKRAKSERIRAAWLHRTQPAVVTLAFAANHLISLGQARDEAERKA